MLAAGSCVARPRACKGRERLCWQRLEAWVFPFDGETVVCCWMPATFRGLAPMSHLLHGFLKIHRTPAIHTAYHTTHFAH